MKNGTLLIVMLCLSFLFSGCGIGGMWMNGNPFPSPVKPYLQHWEKAGMTPSDRRDDSFSCGGAHQDSQSYYTGNEEARMLPGETIWQTRERLSVEWVNCMKSKGYRYVK